MRLLVLAVVGVALGVVVRVVLGRRSSGDDTVAPRPSNPRPSDGSATGSGPAPATEEPRRPTPSLDASAGWEELTATSIGSRPDR